MSQLPTYSNLTEGGTSRYYTGFPLNSTLVSSYTPDTIRSIITQAATRQPYTTAVWIRVNQSGIQISAQDPEISRTRIPVFIPINLAHDIFMLPSINNVICVVYDEPQSKMKGVLLYVIYPSDAQSLREDFRIAKQGKSLQKSQPQQQYSTTVDVLPSDNIQTYVPGKSIVTNDIPRNNKAIQQSSSKRVPYVKENETYLTPTTTTTQVTYVPFRGDYHSEKEEYRRRNKSSRRHKTGYSSSKRSSDSGVKPPTKQRSQSTEKQVKAKSPVNTTPELTQEQIEQQQLLQQQLLQQQQQLLIQQQQQQMAAWQAAQQAPLLPIGIYNRYVPKTIPLPTGETIKTTLPPGTNGATANGTAMTYIVSQPTQTASRSRSNSPQPQQQQQQQQSFATTPMLPRHNTPLNQTYTPPQPNSTVYTNESQLRSRAAPSLNADDETKQYLKLLVEEMHAMKLEMDKIRQSAVGTPKGRSDSIRIDLKEMRSHIEHLRSRMGVTPTIPEK